MNSRRPLRFSVSTLTVKIVYRSNGHEIFLNLAFAGAYTGGYCSVIVQFYFFK